MLRQQTPSSRRFSGKRKMTTIKFRWNTLTSPKPRWHKGSVWACLGHLRLGQDHARNLALAYNIPSITTLRQITVEGHTCDAFCNSFESCGKCTNNEHCGWCADKAQGERCQYEPEKGQHSCAGTPAWTQPLTCCNKDICADHKSCDACTTDPEYVHYWSWVSQ